MTDGERTDKKGLTVITLDLLVENGKLGDIVQPL